MSELATPVHASDRSLKVYEALINSSRRSWLEVDTALPWEQGIDKSMLPKIPEHSWLYGTRFWDMLTEDQRREVLWLENARDVTSFIKLEKFLPVLYIGYINQHGRSLPKQVYDYLTIFSKEEVVHTLMFKRYMRMAALPEVEDPKSHYMSFIQLARHSAPVLGILFTVVVEWAGELNALFNTQMDGIEPLTRKMFREHHIEEVRHIEFGKRIVQDFMAMAPADEVAKLREQFKPMVESLFTDLAYNRQIAAHTSFTFPVAVDDFAAHEEIRQCEHNVRTNKLRFKELTDWLTEMGFQ